MPTKSRNRRSPKKLARRMKPTRRLSRRKGSGKKGSARARIPKKLRGGVTRRRLSQLTQQELFTALRLLPADVVNAAAHFLWFLSICRLFLRRASSRTSSPTQRSQKFPRHRALLLVNRKYWKKKIHPVHLLQPAAPRSLVPRRVRIGMTGSTFFGLDLAICDLAISWDGKSQNRNDWLDFFLSVARLRLGFGPSKG